MFFKREKPTILSFADLMAKLTSAGFRVENQSGGKAKVFKAAMVAVVEDAGDGKCRIGDTGLAIGGEVAVLTELGFQKIFATDGGKRVPALAEHLKALHAFTEDLRETLGLTSLYNESLGTTNERHLYDRVVARDKGVPTRPWERKA